MLYISISQIAFLTCHLPGFSNILLCYYLTCRKDAFQAQHPDLSHEVLDILNVSPKRYLLHECISFLIFDLCSELSTFGMHIALSCICIVTALNFLDNSMIGPDVIASIRLEGTSLPVRYISSASSKLNAANIFN